MKLQTLPLCRLLLLLAIIAGGETAIGQDSFPQKNYPPRLARKDCFLGIHSDFHAKMTDKNIGQNTTRKMVEDLLNIAKIDYLQIDTKGHWGVSSYPTKVGNHGNNLVGDPLRIWREVTAERGIALFAHHSGIWDRRAAQLHPEWQIIGADGKPVAEKMSITSPYAEKLFIPQSIELGQEYGFDGIWYDGESWGFQYDWTPALQEEFKKVTGIQTVPHREADPHWQEWCKFQRKKYKEYMAHYCQEIHKVLPKFEICTNWAFTFRMPEAPDTEVDFLSGDISPMNSINDCRYDSRLFATQGMPWDIMSWSTSASIALTSNNPAKHAKTAIQLSREAASVIAQGGAYQIDFQQVPKDNPPVRDGSIDVDKVRIFADIARFCRERQEVCFKAKPIPQIAVLLSTERSYRIPHGNTPFMGNRGQMGIVACLVENQAAVSVLVTKHFIEHIDEYPLVVVSDWHWIEPECVDRIIKYVQNGGHLLVTSKETEKIFRTALDSAKNKRHKNVSEKYALDLYEVGRGTIGVTKESFFDYGHKTIPEKRELLHSILHELFPRPIVQATGTHDVDVSLMRTVSGKMAIHLVNTSGPHHTQGIIKQIDPVGPVDLSIQLKKKPRSVMQEPGHRKVDWKWNNDNTVSLKLDLVPIHEIIVIDE